MTERIRISFLGGGNMASALIGGMLERGFAAADIQVVELQEEGRKRLAERFGVRAVGAVDDALPGLADRVADADGLGDLEALVEAETLAPRPTLDEQLRESHPAGAEAMTLGGHDDVGANDADVDLRNADRVLAFPLHARSPRCAVHSSWSPGAAAPDRS